MSDLVYHVLLRETVSFCQLSLVPSTTGMTCCTQELLLRKEFQIVKTHGAAVVDLKREYKVSVVVNL